MLFQWSLLTVTQWSRGNQYINVNCMARNLHWLSSTFSTFCKAVLIPVMYLCLCLQSRVTYWPTRRRSCFGKQTLRYRLCVIISLTRVCFTCVLDRLVRCHGNVAYNIPTSSDWSNCHLPSFIDSTNVKKHVHSRVCGSSLWRGCGNHCRHWRLSAESFSIVWCWLSVNAFSLV
jgi:hypothetical protein